MNWAYCKPKLKTLHHVLKILIIKTWKKKEQGEKKQKKAEKNERSLVITYLFSRSSLAITLFVTLCFPFPVTPKTFFVCSPFAQKMRENVGVDFFFKFCLFVSKVCSVFLSHNLRFRYTKNILCTFTNCSKNFVKMLALIFFSSPWLFPKFVFVTHPASFYFCYTKNIFCMFTNCS